MSRTSELKFGLIALRMGLVSQRRLVECAGAWFDGLDVETLTAQPARSLADLMVESGALRPEECATVQPAVARDGDPPDVDPAVRDALLEFRPPAELRVWLLGLSDAPSSGAGFRTLPRDARYEFRGEIARGGLGRVLEGVDRHLGREVAMKLVLDGMPSEVQERFVREARITASLDHPNILPVYDFDEMPGPERARRLVLCMKRIRGRDLGSLLAAISRGEGGETERWSRPRLLRVFQDICLGVAYAHSRGVLHRDLKPSNVMIGEFGETLIVDWGLAREMGGEDLHPEAGCAGGTESPELTLAGDVVGTPHYMSPEQAAGHLSELDGRSDVYSLGGILYTILTGRSPFAGTTRHQVIENVLSGRFSVPSRAIEELRAAHAGPSAQLIPPELEAICLKALAYRKEDRYASARALHDDVQLFLEGVKDQERAEKEVCEHVEGGRAQLKRYRELAAEIEAQRRTVGEWSDRIKAHQSAEEKRPLWDAEARLRRLEEDRIEAFASASAEFGQVLAVKRDSVEALDAKCELFLDRFLEAEGRRDRNEMLLNRRLLEAFDREGRWRAKLDAPGNLSIRAFAHGCGCLAPIRHPEWRVEFAATHTVPWRDGRARPDLPLTDQDRPVPAVKTYPEDVRWGHKADCPRHEVVGAEVWIARYGELDKRLQLGGPKFLGKTPLSATELPQGSWRCTLKADGFADTLLPVRIERGGAWTQDVNLYRPGEIPPGFCYVPGGPFVFGGRHAGGGDEESRVTEDLFVARFPVTAGEYLEFLNALCTAGQRDEARHRQPREGDSRFFAETAPGFELPPADDPRTLMKGPSLPVLGVSWFDALAFLEWRSKRDGVPFTLMHEEEWEKTARGVDARTYPYGDDYDGSYSHGSVSLPGKTRPMPVGSFPVDESPFGVRDLSGGAVTWCLNAAELPNRELCCLRGGAWTFKAGNARGAYRLAHDPTFVHRVHGFRPAVRPRAGN